MALVASSCAATRLLGRTYDATRRRFDRAFAEYGLPDRIRSDNGGPFASPGLGGLSQLAVWWIRLGIVPERIAPGHPEQNGSHEQFHAVLKADTARPPAATAGAQQRRFARFCADYNDERPHEALDNTRPASRYHAVPRAVPARLPALDYPGPWEVRLVEQQRLRLVAPRAAVCLPRPRRRICRLRRSRRRDLDGALCHGRPGRFDERQRRLHPIAAVTSGRSASSAGSARDLKNKKT